MTRQIAVVVFPNFQLLDAAGPISAFDIAARYRPGAYAIHVLASGGGQIPSSAGAGFAAGPLVDGPPGGGHWDTLMVAGGDASRAVGEFADVVAWLKRVAPTARRVTSVCSGAYFLAEAGLLRGRRATTHWSRTDHFARRYPRVRLDADRIFIRDGNVWTVRSHSVDLGRFDTQMEAFGVAVSEARKLKQKGRPAQVRVLRSQQQYDRVYLNVP